jgi:hypothetical protein
MSTGHFDRRAKQLSRLNKTVEETSTEPQTASSLSRAESEPSRVKQMTVGEGRKTTEPHGIEVRKPAAPRALSLAHVSTGVWMLHRRAGSRCGFTACALKCKGDERQGHFKDHGRR